MRPLVAARAALEHRRYLAACHNPQQAYARLWQRTASLLRRGPFWQRRGVQSSWRQHAITDYTTYIEPLARSAIHGHSELTGEPILFWSESSGTTGVAKTFPITPSFRAQYSRCIGPMLHQQLRQHRGFLRHPMLFLSGSAPSETTPTGVGIGLLSYFNYAHLPRLVRQHYVVPLAALRDAATLTTWGPVYALAKDLSAMFAVTPLNLSHWLDGIRSRWDELLHCLARPHLRPAGLPPWHISAERLGYLQTLDPRRCTVRDLWPSMQFVSCWKTSVCATQLAALLPQLDVPVVDLIYSATEGWLNVPDATGGDGGPLHPGAHIVEFLPLHQEVRESNLLQPWELQTGGEYEVFLTTAMGLVRYRLRDIVRCTGWLARSPRLQFERKVGRDVSLGLFTVGEHELLRAAHDAGITLQPSWRFAPNGAGSGLALYLPTGDTVAAEQLTAVHNLLCQRNTNYAMEMAGGTMLPLHVRSMPQSMAHATRAPLHNQSKPCYLLQRSPEEVS